MSFTHLHVHTQFSIADATTRLSALCKQTAALGMDAVAITDHDNLHGAVQFTRAAKEAGIKPIYGCCLSIAARAVGEHVLRTHHVTLLAENHVGYLNLLRLISKAHLLAPQGGKPRVDHQLLADNNEGLICLSGDLAGEIPNALLRGEDRNAHRHVRQYLEVFGKERFFLEVQNSGLVEEQKLLPRMQALADRYDLRCVATGDTHYLKKSGARAHEVLMCIGMGLKVQEDSSWLPTNELYLADEKEMRRRFSGLPDAVDAAFEVGERCKVQPELSKIYLPKFEVPADHTIESYFALQSRNGLEDRFAEFQKLGKVFDEATYRARLQTEIDVVLGMEFPGYFLIVWDFIRWARDNDIPVGPGRGSGAGSLVAYSLRITDIDPLPYDLLFERFLNPERVSMPDFDIDFCVKRRNDVIAYVADKYGSDHVAQIATFGTLKAKGAIRDTGRVLGMMPSEVDEVAKLVPDDANNLADALKREPRLRDRAAQDPRIGQLVDTAMEVEGAVRNVGMHAAGVVISEEPLWHYVPVSRGNDGENVTQFDKDDVEKAGLVKFDFLGLKNLTMIQHAVVLINAGRDPDTEPFAIISIPLDSKPAFDVISAGDTAGIFQMEGGGFTRMIQKLQPSCFEDIIAAGALFRPGPLDLGMDETYINRKHGREQVQYEHPLLEPILRETYGVVIYQEQVMRIAREMAGFSLGGADILRRAMGKKKAEEMEKQRILFLQGTREREIADKIATTVFDQMEAFARYGFNKSHAAAYGLITYQTAWLKAHHPTEFFAALLTADKDDTDKVVQYIQEARRHKIAVLPPDINASELTFSVHGDVIRFGLGAIKNVGGGAVEVLLQARKDGPFESLFDLCRRIDGKRVNRRVIETMVKCGALDCFDQPREVLWANIDKALERANAEQREKETGQGSLFGSFGASPVLVVQDVYLPTREAWTARTTLEYEKQCLGFYVTGHPLDRYKGKLWRLESRPLATAKTVQVLEGARRGRVSLKSAVVVVNYRERITKTGRRMAILVVEDLSGQAELTCFDPQLTELSETLKSNVPLLLTVEASRDRRDESVVSLKVLSADSLDNAVASMSDYLKITLDVEHCEAKALRELRDVLNRGRRAYAGVAEVIPINDAAREAMQARQADLLSDPGDGDRVVAPSPEDQPASAEPSPTDASDAAEAERARAEQEAFMAERAADGPQPAVMSEVMVELQVRVPGKGLARIIAGNGLQVLPTEELIGELERLIGRGRVALG